jgi:hypothetical protein
VWYMMIAITLAVRKLSPVEREYLGYVTLSERFGARRAVDAPIEPWMSYGRGGAAGLAMTRAPDGTRTVWLAVPHLVRLRSVRVDSLAHAAAAVVVQQRHMVSAIGVCAIGCAALRDRCAGGGTTTT